MTNCKMRARSIHATPTTNSVNTTKTPITKRAASASASTDTSPLRGLEELVSLDNSAKRGTIAATPTDLASTFQEVTDVNVTRDTEGQGGNATKLMNVTSSRESVGPVTSA